MSKKLYAVVAILVLATLVFSACAPKATEVPAAKIKVCQVTDTGGIDDKSFNATAWKGVTMPRHTWASKANTWNPKKSLITKRTSTPSLKKNAT